MSRNQTIIFAALTAFFALFCRSAACAESVSEYDLKMAFLYNFAQFTEWPAEAFAEADSPFVFCALNAEAYGDSLESLQSKFYKGRKILVRRLTGNENARKCHVLFLPAAEKNRYEQIIADIKNSATLTVGEEVGMLKKGAMLNLSIVDRKLHFDVNLDAASNAKLSISSRLLKLADSVLKEKE